MEKNTDLNKYAEIPGEVFIQALYNTIYTMMGVEVTKKDSFDHEYMKGNQKIAGAMVLSGEKNLLLIISVNRTTAAVLVSYMTGVDINELKDEDLYDGITEIANMIAGSAKEALAQTEYHYTLTSPFAIVGNNFEILTKKSVKNYSQWIGSDEIEIMLQIFNF